MMKKVLLTAAACLFAQSAWALDCAYAPEQEIVPLLPSGAAHRL